MRRTPRALAIAAALLACTPFLEGQGEGGSESESDSGSEGPSCEIGSLACSCTAGGGCDPGLECVAGLCSEPLGEGETGPCTELGCACEGPGDCDPGLVCAAGVCEPDSCGDGVVDPNETCDDGNGILGDGCDNDCTRTEILDIAAGGVHTCALIEGGRIRCWGHNGAGQIGYGDSEDIGDDEHPASAGDLPLPAATALMAGGGHTCALFEDQNLRCWGFNANGQLGYGNSFTVFALGDDESIEGLAAVELISAVDEVGVGVIQTCVRTAGQLRCWGAGAFGQLGLGSTFNVGDDELPLDLPAVMLGGEPVALGIGGAHGCAILAGGGVRCWGRNDFGQLGLGTNIHVGDDEAPASVPELDVRPPTISPNASVVDVGAGLNHSCALFSTGEVLCWGANEVGQLGQGNNITWGDQPGEVPAALTPIELGGFATALSVGYQHSCALIDGGAVRCWGDAAGGQLGYGDEDPVGLAILPGDRDPVETGANVVRVSAGGAHTCVILEDSGVMCWGSNEYGQLGYGFSESIGDDEIPIIAGTVELL